VQKSVESEKSLVRKSGDAEYLIEKEQESIDARERATEYESLMMVRSIDKRVC
jgi:hypothetical protein